ncbi:MAG: orotate phosphoribosyltransferase [Clostridiaceae bacterium]|jgi:orotate phosphoribosyltransferase|nr:orotate phosphoribosyltransferase [Clostridiaceae bacterium]
MNKLLIDYLFKTNAIRVCPKDKPFWYTSGRIGPYYVNTHFLFGSETKANAFLADIDRLKEDKLSCSNEMHKISKENYQTDEIYKGTIDALVNYIKENFDAKEIDLISGGERRDWFFSFMVAELLDKPHITLFKDLSAVVYKNGKSVEAGNCNEKNVLHIADLITTASSYERAWVPAVNKLGAGVKWSLVVVDRLQGGKEVLAHLGVKSYALVDIDPQVFEKAKESGYIDESQLTLVLDYIGDPESSMKKFLENNQDFLLEALAGGDRIAQRARLLVENDFYNVSSFFQSL